MDTELNIVQIPKNLKRRVTSYSKNYYHYELVEIYPHHVVYKCIETGVNESFSKNEFVKPREI